MDCHMSTDSLQPSRSHIGLTGQTLKPSVNTLGTSKTGNSEVKKVLQMAAAAANKVRSDVQIQMLKLTTCLGQQQEENDKKAARLKEMENRRLLAMQRKAEEIRSRTLEQERKVKEEGERRKREREENIDKRPTKAGVKKVDSHS